MTRLDRLVLDAIEKHSPHATVVHHVWPFVDARRWSLFGVGMSVYVSLMRLENAGLIASRWDDSMSPEELQRRGGNRRRLYSRTERELG